MLHVCTNSGTVTVSNNVTVYPVPQSKHFFPERAPIHAIVLLTTNQGGSSVIQHLTWSRASLNSADCWVPANTRSLLESCILKSLIYNPMEHITSSFSMLKFENKSSIIKFWNTNKLLDQFLIKISSTSLVVNVGLLFLGNNFLLIKWIWRKSTFTV